MENFKLPINYDVNVEVFSSILSSNLTNSYKIYWFKAIFDYANKGIRIISMDKLLARMLANAWNICINTNLSLGNMDKLREYILDIVTLYPNLKEEDDIDIIENKIINITSKTIKKKINNLLEYVPYRLLTPFLKEFNLALTPEKTEKYIEKCSLVKKDVLYKICNKTIFINESYYEYIRKNNIIILKWINYNLENYLKKKNEEDYIIIEDEEEKECCTVYDDNKKYKKLVLDINTKKYIYLCEEEKKENVLRVAGSDIRPPQI